MSTTVNLLSSDDNKVENYFPELGISFDSAFLETRLPLLTGTPKQSGAAPADLKDIFIYEFTSDQQSFSRKVKASASGKASFGIGKAKASASQSKFFSSNSYSCYVFGYMRLIHPRYHFDLTEVKLEPNVEQFIKENYKNDADAIELSVGDEVITAITPCSEILVKLEIQTHSEKQKEEIKASASFSGKYASGSAKFSSIVSKIQSSKKISIQVMGDFPEKFLADITPEAVDRLLLDFPATAGKNFSIIEYIKEPVRNVPMLLKYKKFVDVDELEQRQIFLQHLDSLYQDLLDWIEDIEYVLSDSNKNEFTDEVKATATADKIRCMDAIAELDALLSKAKKQWIKKGKNEGFFERSQLDKFPKEFPIYARIEPPAPVAAVVAKPAPKKRQPPNDSRNDHGTGGPH